MSDNIMDREEAVRLAYGLLWHMQIDRRDANLRLASALGADTVIADRSADAADADPVTESPTRSSAGPDISSPVRAAVAPVRYNVML